MRHWTTSVHNGAVEKASASPTGAISLARRFSFSRASRFILSFICEYFLKTCASLWRSSCVTHSSATPPALSLEFLGMPVHLSNRVQVRCVDDLLHQFSVRRALNYDRVWEQASEDDEQNTGSKNPAFAWQRIRHDGKPGSTLTQEEARE
ncbi:MAG TPA: hypothetical protein VMM16_15575 [Verrucomicrobiae bacterium]|nr:hypothetical protein [Verrucomicrobiae bacterium]